MILRKINAALSMVITLMLMVHVISLTAWMLSRGTIMLPANNMPWILAILMVVHAVICIAFAILGHKGAEKREYNSYPHLNLPTMVQRMSGMLLLLFTALHVAGASGAMTPPQVVHAIMPPLFYTLAMAHVAVSTSKAFITLGIGNAKFIKAVDVVVKVVCAITLIASITGFYLHSF